MAILSVAVAASCSPRGRLVYISATFKFQESQGRGKMLTPKERKAKIKTVFRVASGNFLEMYDFMIFGYFSAAIGRAYFPATSEFASLMFSMTTFAVGFMIRPLGAIFLGAYIDHVGRRKGLLVTLGLMSVGTLTIAMVPGYATIGLFAPIIVVFGRLCQGFSAGVELGGVSVYLSEIATPGHKGFYVSWQSGSQQVAVIFAGVLGVALSRFMRPEDLQAWGWRIPLIVGCLIIPFIYLIRRTLRETDEFAARSHHPSSRRNLRRNAGELANRAYRGGHGADDQRVFLHHNRLHADFRQGDTQADAKRCAAGNTLGRLVEFILAAGHGFPVRSDRQAPVAGVLRHYRDLDRLPGHDMVGVAAKLQQTAARRALVVIHLRQL